MQYHFKFAHVIDREEEIIVFGAIEAVTPFYDNMRKTEIYEWFDRESMMRFLDMEIWQDYPHFLRVDADKLTLQNLEYQEANRLAKIHMIASMLNELGRDRRIGPALRKKSANELFELGRNYIDDILKSVEKYFTPDRTHVFISELVRNKFIEESERLEGKIFEPTTYS